MMTRIVNCDVNLKNNFGIDMQAIGAYDHLVVELSKLVLCWALEYDFLADSIKFETEEGTEIPDLSQFGEVVPNDDSMG